jgi:hypothetical protein
VEIPIKTRRSYSRRYNFFEWHFSVRWPASA